MMGLPVIVLVGALALLAYPAEAAHRHRKVAKPPSMSSRSPAQDMGSYYVPYVTDTGGAHVPIMQLPGSVVVIPRQVIEDQQDITVCGALRNVSGVFCP